MQEDLVNKMTKILLVGCGRMGGAILKALQQNQQYQIAVLDSNIAVQMPNATVKFYTDHNQLQGQNFDVVILAVKPQIITEIIANYRELINDALIVSIIAGKKLEFFAAHCNKGQKIVRIMPNLAAQNIASMSVAVANEHLNEHDKNKITEITESFGKILWLENEQQMDVATAISGSGPAYFFYFMQCLQQAAMANGLSAEQAKLLVSQTALGSVGLADTNTDLQNLIDSVCSPGGTTEAAIKEFKQANKFADITAGAVQAAIERSIELAK